MTFFRSAVFAAGVLAAVSAAEIHCSIALAAEGATQAPEGGAAVATQPGPPTAEDAAGDKKKLVVKRKKGRKKGSARREPAAEAVYSPGEKLTVNQVLDVIKTTRNLSGKNLSGLQLVGVNLGRCNLKGADLSHANLERADLEESNLERADLSGANLRMATLRLSGMTGANLERAILDGAVWKDGRVCAPGSVGHCREFTAPNPPGVQSAPISPAGAAPAPSGSQP